jgi:hypothetical protein
MRTLKGFVVLLGLATIGLAPGLAQADSEPYSCGNRARGYGQVCVAAYIDNDIGPIICATSTDRKPYCFGYAIVGASAKSPTGSSGILHFQAVGAGGPVTMGVWRPFATNFAQGSRTWKGSTPVRTSRLLITPIAYGPVRGCVTYKATWQDVAHAGTNKSIKTLPDGQTITYSVHDHAAQRRYCVPK